MANIGTDILSLPIASILDGQEWVPLVKGGTTERTRVSNLGFASITSVFPAGIDYIMSGGTAIVPTGVNGPGLQVPFNCSIQAAVINGDNPLGSIVVDIWKCTETQYDGGATHPAVGDSIAGGNPLTITNASKATSDLSGWTTTLTQGDWLWFNVNSVLTFSSVTVALRVSRVLP